MRPVHLGERELEPDFPRAPLTTTTHVRVVVPQKDGTVVLPLYGGRGLTAPDGVELSIRD